MPGSKRGVSTISDRLREAMDLKRRRDGKRVTVQQIADAAGVSRASASLWLNNPGPEGPKRAAIEKVAAFLGVTRYLVSTPVGTRWSLIAVPSDDGQRWIGTPLPADPLAPGF